MSAFRFPAIGTDWQIDTPAPLGPALQSEILDAVARFDRIWSRFRTDSTVAALGAAAEGGVFAFPAEGAALFAAYDRLYAMTDGAVDPLVGADLERLGYDRAYSLRPREAVARARPDWRRDVGRDGATLRTQGPVVLDVGAAGKGMLVDQIADLLHAASLDAFVVDGSGDMRHAGAGPLRVGLHHPFAADRVVGIVPIRDQALCASAITRRAWGEGLHHVIDHRTGAPTRDVVATWAVAPDAMTADGLATAAFFAAAERLPDGDGVAWVRQFANGRLEASSGFWGELYC